MNKIFSADIEQIGQMIEFVLEAARHQGLDGKELNMIRLSLEEALVNVINYAYPEGDGNVEIIYRLENSKGLVIDIVDTGIPFNPLDKPIPDINLALEERPIGGMGIYLIRQNMDEVKYKREHNKNILTLTKYYKTS
ncbi:ATP-binding protein [Candidatus Latescibacterota bacterium]